MTEPPADFCIALTVLRLSRGWTQDQLAKASAMTNSALSEYERGKKVPELKSVRKMVAALGYPLSAVDRVEDCLRDLRLESLVEARSDPDGGHVLVPIAPEEISSSTPASLRTRSRRVAAHIGQAVTGFTLLLFDVLLGSGRARS